MSGRWPASILSQAYPHKTTASLSSTNSKSLVYAFRIPLGSIFEHYSMPLKVLMCRQYCTSLCLATLYLQFCPLISKPLLFSASSVIYRHGRFLKNKNKLTVWKYHFLDTSYIFILSKRFYLLHNWDAVFYKCQGVGNNLDVTGCQ